MKKLMILIVCVFLFGCSKGEEVSCNINGKKAVFTIDEGFITSYKIGDKKVSRAEIDEINGTYFTSSTNNEEGKATLKDYVISLGGTCDYE